MPDSVHSTLSIPQSLSTSSNMVRDNSETKYLSPVDVKANFSSGHNSTSTVEEMSTTKLGIFYAG